jgi:hypothetical protein
MGKFLSIEKLIGVKYGRLTIIGDAPKKNRSRFVKVKCECGVETELALHSLKSGNTKSCGCGKLNGTRLTNKIYDGIIFGKLMVINEVAGVRKSGGSINRVMECECECGNIKNIRLNYLKSGKTTSCGCYMRKLSSEANSKKLTVGQERGYLTMIKELDKKIVYNEKGGVTSTIRYVEVLCNKCGSTSNMTVYRFSNDKSANHCGCGIGESLSKALKNNIDFNKKYGRLTILKEIEPVNFTTDSNGNVYYRRRVQCECECGVIKDINLAVILNEKSTSSCGCYQREIASQSNITHGLTTTIENKSMYARWKGMLYRCYNSSNSAYYGYGGRGITVCDEWRDDVMTFIKDMGYPPSNEYSLDRIDVDGNYEPSNCRWATIDIQSNNKRNNKWYKNNEPNPTI